nr:MAG TPA: hypothetical protein [Caudoviricetes sp.]
MCHKFIPFQIVITILRPSRLVVEPYFSTSKIACAI